MEEINNNRNISSPRLQRGDGGEAARIVVLGAGESGAGAAVLAKVKGFDTFVSDMSAIKDKYKELLDTYASMPKVRPMMAELPAAMPSMPSFRLAPLETAVTTKMVMMTNKTHPAVCACSPIKPTRSE